MFQKFNLTQDAIVLHAGLPPSGSFPLSSVTATTPFTSTHILTGGEDQQTDSKAAMPLDLARAQQSPVMQVQLAGQLVSAAGSPIVKHHLTAASSARDSTKAAQYAQGFCTLLPCSMFYHLRQRGASCQCSTK